MRLSAVAMMDEICPRSPYHEFPALPSFAVCKHGNDVARMHITHAFGLH